MPKAPEGKEGRWIKATPGKGRFTFFHIFGPQKGAFDGSWKPGDFEEVKSLKRQPVKISGSLILYTGTALDRAVWDRADAPASLLA